MVTVAKLADLGKTTSKLHGYSVPLSYAFTYQLSNRNGNNWVKYYMSIITYSQREKTNCQLGKGKFIQGYVIIFK